MFESRRRYRGRLPADVTTSRLRTLPAVTLPAGPRFWSVRVPSTGFGTRFGAVAGVEPAAQAPNASARPCSYRPAPNRTRATAAPPLSETAASPPPGCRQGPSRRFRLRAVRSGRPTLPSPSVAQLRHFPFPLSLLFSGSTCRRC